MCSSFFFNVEMCSSINKLAIESPQWLQQILQGSLIDFKWILKLCFFAMMKDPVLPYRVKGGLNVTAKKLIEHSNILRKWMLISMLQKQMLRR